MLISLFDSCSKIEFWGVWVLPNFCPYETMGIDGYHLCYQPFVPTGQWGLMVTIYGTKLLC